MAKDENYCEHCHDEVSHTTETHEFDGPADAFERSAWSAAGPNPQSPNRPASPHWSSSFNDRRQSRAAVKQSGPPMKKSKGGLGPNGEPGLTIL
jgi:hypothetical protein